MAMNHRQIKVKGQLVTHATHGRTDTTDLITLPTNAVDNNGFWDILGILYVLDERTEKGKINAANR